MCVTGNQDLDMWIVQVPIASFSCLRYFFIMMNNVVCRYERHFLLLKSSWALVNIYSANRYFKHLCSITYVFHDMVN